MGMNTVVIARAPTVSNVTKGVSLYRFMDV